MRNFAAGVYVKLRKLRNAGDQALVSTRVYDSTTGRTQPAIQIEGCAFVSYT